MNPDDRPCASHPRRPQTTVAVVRRSIGWMNGVQCWMCEWTFRHPWLRRLSLFSNLSCVGASEANNCSETGSWLIGGGLPGRQFHDGGTTGGSVFYFFTNPCHVFEDDLFSLSCFSYASVLCPGSDGRTSQSRRRTRQAGSLSSWQRPREGQSCCMKGVGFLEVVFRRSLDPMRGASTNNKAHAICSRARFLAIGCSPSFLLFSANLHQLKHIYNSI
jgi:hypothetical protein